MSTDRDIADQPLDDVDRTILDTVAEVFRAADPVPAGLTEDIKFALTVQAMHAEVAELQRVGAESALARSEYTRTQTLTFSAETISVMVTHVADRRRRGAGRRVGHRPRLAGAGRDPRRDAHASRAEVDDDGRFTIDPAPRGLVRFVFLPEGDVRPVITPTVEI